MGFHNSNGITNNGRYDKRQRKIKENKPKTDKIDVTKHPNLVHKSFFDLKNIPKLKKIEQKINAMQIPKKWT